MNSSPDPRDHTFGNWVSEWLIARPYVAVVFGWSALVSWLGRPAPGEQPMLGDDEAAA